MLKHYLSVDDVLSPGDIELASSPVGALAPITNFQAYPNPLTETININIGAQSNESSLTVITDLMGKVVYKESITGSTQLKIDMSRKRPGIYILNKTSNTGSQSLQSPGKWEFSGQKDKSEDWLFRPLLPPCKRVVMLFPKKFRSSMSKRASSFLGIATPETIGKLSLWPCHEHSPTLLTRWHFETA